MMPHHPLSHFFLHSYGYESLKDKTRSSGSMSASDVAGNEELKDIMFLLICMIPLVLSVMQLYVWKFYSLRDTKTQSAKHLET